MDLIYSICSIVGWLHGPSSAVLAALRDYIYFFCSKSEFSPQHGGSWNSDISFCCISVFKTKRYMVISSNDSPLLLVLSTCENWLEHTDTFPRVLHAT